jgi:cytochrome c oxidase subunit 2
VESTAPGGFWMPPEASTVASNVDNLFFFIFWITVFFFFLVLVLMTYFCIKYRHRKGHEEADPAPAHSTALELTWTVIPTVLVLMIFYFGFRGFLHMNVAPPNAYEINVDAKMWQWEFVYPNGYVDTELHIPLNTPVRAVLQSQDVIHSLFIPQFRVKKDAVPGRYNRMWFEATELSPPEGFDIYCAEYCGTSHSTMRAKVIVQTPEDFKAWMDRVSNPFETHTPAEVGKMYVEKRGCLQCHSLEDKPGPSGPSLKNVFGEKQLLSDGSEVLADENYIRESLYEPNAKIVKGFNPIMPSQKATFKERDVGAVIEYLKTISDKYKNQTISVGATSGPTSRPGNQ